jgi:hypothetical protein
MDAIIKGLAALIIAIYKVSFQVLYEVFKQLTKR